MSDDVHGQAPGPSTPEPSAELFSDEELLRALRIPFGDAEARAMIESSRQRQREARERYQEWARDAERRKQLGLQPLEAPFFYSLWSDDTLIVLSLLSEPLRAKVERYRRAQWHGPGKPDPAAEEAWQARRELLRPWVEERRGSPPP